MRSLLLALLCAAPLAVGYGVGDAPVPEPTVQAEAVYLASMGCDLPDCTDPTHFHHCLSGCAEAGHYHDCPAGCQETLHGHGVCYVEEYEQEPVFYSCMGCTDPNCTDPTHYHHCVAGCTDPAHYHDCPMNCQNPAHPHWGSHHSNGRGHHGGRRHH